MADVYSVEKRSDVMSKIRSSDNKLTEIALIKILRRNKISGWRRKQKMFGKPDFVFHRERVAMFIDGCFWHLCPLHGRMPINNKTFWENKLFGNRRRDLLVERELSKNGWKVLRIWEHELGTKTEHRLVLKIRQTLKRKNIL